MVIKAQSTSRMNKNTSAIECLDEYDIEEEGFIEGDMAISHYYDYIFKYNGTFTIQEEKNITS